MTGFILSPTRTKRINLMTQKNFKETWLPLVHLFQHPDGNFMYEVSNTGFVRQKTKQGYRMVKISRNCEGYNVVSLKSVTGTFVRMYLHRLVGVVFLNGQNISGSDTINHKDENKDNNHISNLEWVPRSENIRLAHQSKAIPNHGFKPHPVKAARDNKEYTFRTATQCAMFIGCSTHAVIAGIKNHYKPGGWQITSLLPPKEINGNLFNESDFE